MAANDEFPRGLTQTQGFAEAPSINYPASAGVSWVLDSWTLECVVVTTGSGLGTVYIEANGTGIGAATVDLATLASTGSDSSTAPLVFPADTALTVTVNNTDADVQCLLHAHAYPI